MLRRACIYERLQRKNSGSFSNFANKTGKQSIVS
jgi:hypothetical protein